VDGLCDRDLYSVEFHADAARADTEAELVVV